MGDGRQFQIGDEAWIACWTPRNVEVLCPVCAGKRVVTVILGGGEHVQTLCDCCGAGYEGPRGTVTGYEYEPRAELARVTEIRVRESGTGREVECVFGDHYIPDAANVCADRESALARSRAMIEEQARYDDARLRAKKDGTLKKASWIVGYHRKEAKECRRRAEYHEARANTVQPKPDREPTNAG